MSPAFTVGSWRFGSFEEADDFARDLAGHDGRVVRIDRDGEVLALVWPVQGGGVSTDLTQAGTVYA